MTPGGDLAYVQINGTVRRIRFAGGANRAPVAHMGSDRTSGLTPLTVAFNSTGTNDPDGDAITYDWDFGDGTAHSTAANPSHTYSVAGNYTARLTVRDSRGATDSATIAITAGNRSPVPTITPAPATFRAGDRIVARGSASDPEEGNLPPSALRLAGQAGSQRSCARSRCALGRGGDELHGAHRPRRRFALRGHAHRDGLPRGEGHEDGADRAADPQPDDQQLADRRADHLRRARRRRPSRSSR